ncbi:hypothetical protein PG997_006938 [Apiospora hydei]|uniref:MYND-type domain-containing protein n=1 Tax=Apiospora hydei TaxID=1337664 RepID=A0ABR1WQ44_9PEZI
MDYRGTLLQYTSKLYSGTFFPVPDDGRTLEQHDPSIDNLCVMCDKPGLQKCGRCGAGYCSKECHAEDWPLHKAICRDLAGRHALSQRPGPRHYRCLFFSATEAAPKLVWGSDNLDNLALDPIVMNYTMPFRKCGHGLCLLSFDRGTRLMGSLPMNGSIIRLAPTLGSTKIQFGDVLIYSHHPTSPSAVQHLDFTVRDLRSVADFFQSMKANPCIGNPARFPTSFYNCEMWPAIKVNCDGDIERLSPFLPHGKSLDRYQDVFVPSVDLEAQQMLMAWPHLLGLPWMLRRPYTNLTIKDPDLRNDAVQWFPMAATHSDPFLTSMEPKNLDERGSELGTLIIHHANGAKISPLHLQWLQAWLTEVRVTNRMPDAEFGDMVKSLQEHLKKGEKLTDDELGRLTGHWNDFLEKNRHDPEAATIVSPWDI